METADPAETTISVNGGPKVPLSTVKQALDIVNGDRSNSVSADQLRLFIERIERLAEEKQGIADDIKDVFAEAKSTGFDTRTMRRMIALRKMESHVRQEQAALAETYASALGLQYPLL